MYFCRYALHTTFKKYGRRAGFLSTLLESSTAKQNKKCTPSKPTLRENRFTTYSKFPLLSSPQFFAVLFLAAAACAAPDQRHHQSIRHGHGPAVATTINKPHGQVTKISFLEKQYDRNTTTFPAPTLAKNKK